MTKSIDLGISILSGGNKDVQVVSKQLIISDMPRRIQKNCGADVYQVLTACFHRGC